MSTTESPVTDRPLRADARRNHERLLEAACDVFAEQGPDAPVAAIARRAGVGPGTLFRHFPTKHDLFVAAVLRCFSEVTDAVDDGLRDDDPWRGVAGTVTACVAMQARNRCVMEALTPEIISDPRMQEAWGAAQRDLEVLLERAQRAGVVRDDVKAIDLPLLAKAVGKTLEELERTHPGSDHWRRYLQIALDGLRPAGATPLDARAPDPAGLLRADGGD